ncbi:hypothetical protein GCM10009578_038720 [Streptomyces rhizosphaericus]
MASRLSDGNEQNLQRFVNHSTWRSVPVQQRICERMLPLISPATWMTDDVSVPKDGDGHRRPRRGRRRGGRAPACEQAAQVWAVAIADSETPGGEELVGRRQAMAPSGPAGHEDRLVPELDQDVAGLGAREAQGDNVVSQEVSASADHGEGNPERETPATRQAMNRIRRPFRP